MVVRYGWKVNRAKAVPFHSHFHLLETVSHFSVVVSDEKNPISLTWYLPLIFVFLKLCYKKFLFIGDFT